jgi:hypothetical protein
MSSPPPAGSPLLIDEYFGTSDPRFLAEVLACQVAPRLKALAAKWFDDPRPAMRRMLLNFVDDGCDRSGHRPLVKQLFKLAEADSDHELLAHFLCAFDRFVKHQLVTVHRYDVNTRKSFAEKRMKDVTRVLAACPTKDRDVKRNGELVRFGSPPHVSPWVSRFSRGTRLYLQRRVFRYFRVLGRRDPVAFRKAALTALALYRDENLQTAEQLIDSWSLIHLLYRDSRAIRRDSRGVRVAKNGRLADLSFAPLYPAIWEESTEDLVTLASRAECRTVRLFAVTSLRRDPERTAAALTLPRLRDLLKSPHEEVLAFAVEFLRLRPDLGTLTVSEWLDLLSVAQPLALLEICALLKEHVAPSRLDISQCVALACSPVAPVAELGAGWLEGKTVETPEDLEQLARSRDAVVPSVRQDLTRYLLLILSVSKDARAGHIRDLVDSRYADVRAIALDFLKDDPPLTQSALFWSQIAESPYPDVQAFVVEFLERLEGRVDEGTVRHLWMTALLAVHRGGKTRRASLAQIGTRLAEHPSEAPDLMPVAGMMLRSLRDSERRAALSTIARAVRRRPSLKDEANRLIPGFTLTGEASE